MVGRTTLLSLLLSLSTASVTAIDLDVNSQDSIKSTAKTLAAGIVAKYDADLKSSGIPGLFNAPYYWWEAGTIMNALIGYSYLTGDTQYDTKVSQAIQWQTGTPAAFMPTNQTKTLGNDDQSCWGLAAMTAAEVGFPKPKDMEWIDLAENVFDTQTARWNTKTCGGGLNWMIFNFNAGYSYKNSWSNGNYFLLAARLAKFTGNTTYTQWADKSFKWALDIGLVTKDFQVFDGTDENTDCKNINKLQWTATQGIYAEGAALMYNITGAQNWTDTVQGLVKASSVFQESSSSPVLVEAACERNGRCDYDQKAFKGVFSRTMARAALAAPIVKDSINKILSTSAKAAAAACSGDGENVKCPFVWTASAGNTNSSSAIGGNLGEVYDVLEVVQGLLYPQAKALRTSTSPPTANGSASGNPSQSGGASRTSSANGSQATGSAGAMMANVFVALAFAVVAVIVC